MFLLTFSPNQTIIFFQARALKKILTIQNKKGITTYLCEVKPLRQCKPPTNRKSKYFLTEQRTYAINQAKWMAAKKHCEKMGWTWKIITEKELKV